MNTAQMIEALKSEDFDRDALVQALEEKAEREAPFRERPSVRTHLESLKDVRKEFTKWSYSRDAEKFAAAIDSMVDHLQAIKVEAGLVEETEVEEA